MIDVGSEVDSQAVETLDRLEANGVDVCGVVLVAVGRVGGVPFVCRSASATKESRSDKLARDAWNAISDHLDTLIDRTREQHGFPGH